jgi:hypothetical protein
VNLCRACLAALILAPWLALAGAMLVGYELLAGHRPLRLAAGCVALVVAFEVGSGRKLGRMACLSRTDRPG